MALTKKTTNKTGLGRMVVYMTDGNKTTESVDCPRADAVRRYSEILQINGPEAKLMRVVFNGVQIYPEKTTFSTKELCDYLPEHPKVNTVKAWVRKKKIPFHKAGSAKNSPTYFIIEEIKTWEKNGRAI